MDEPMRPLVLALTLAVLPAVALADPYAESGASQASAESAEGVAALAEAGVKVVAGTVALPVALAGSGSLAAGGSAAALAGAASAVGGEVLTGASELADFAFAPLTVTDDVIVRAQPAPAVPFAAQPRSPR